MAVLTHDDDDDDGHPVPEIIAGYALILAIAGVMFGFAKGMGIEVPWGVLAGTVVLGAFQAVLLARRGNEPPPVDLLEAAEQPE